MQQNVKIKEKEIEEKIFFVLFFLFNSNSSCPFAAKLASFDVKKIFCSKCTKSYFKQIPLITK